MRTIRVLAIAALLGAASILVPPGRAEGIPAPARPLIQITPDKAHRRFEIHAKLAILVSPDEDINFAEDFARLIKAQIERIWSGTRYKCWDVVTTVDVKVYRATQTSSDSVDPDAIEIQVLANPNPVAPARSFVPGSGPATADPFSDSPQQRYGAYRQGSTFYLNNSTWNEPWAHEFGHLMGLDDSYETVHGVDEVIDGLPNDVMALNTEGTASPQTITKLLRRNGIDLSQVKCPMSMDTVVGTVNALGFGTGTFQIHAWTCDYDPASTDPKQRPQVVLQGVLRITGTVTQGQADSATKAANAIKAAGELAASFVHTTANLPATPTFNAGSGTVDYVIAISTTGQRKVPVTIEGSPVPFTYFFGWNITGLLEDARPGALIEGLPGEALAPIANLKMAATFTEGASECP